MPRDRLGHRAIGDRRPRKTGGVQTGQIVPVTREAIPAQAKRWMTS